MVQESGSNKSLLIAAAAGLVVLILVFILWPSGEQEERASDPSGAGAPTETAARTPAAGQRDPARPGPSAGIQRERVQRNAQRADDSQRSSEPPSARSGQAGSDDRGSDGGQAEAGQPRRDDSDRENWVGGIPPEIARAYAEHDPGTPDVIIEAHRSRREPPPEIWDSFNQGDTDIPPEILRAHEAHEARPKIDPESMNRPATQAELESALP